MKETIKKLLYEAGIEYSAVLPYSECDIINPQIAARMTFEPKSVIFMLAPYNCGIKERTVSLYAVPRDYHLFFRDLFSGLESKLKELFPDNCFRGYADSTPVSELKGAAMCGLGVIGDNSMIINEKYGSYVFIGELITDAELASDRREVRFCPHCGACREKCPEPDYCYSALTQKKGELTPSEAEKIRNSKIKWGCDVCQEVCPLNVNVQSTPIEFFCTELTPSPSAEIIEKMSDEEFSQRAYSWRGKKTIIRNLTL